MPAAETASTRFWLAGLGVFGITMVAFFRVPVIPAIGHDLRLTATQIGLFTTCFGTGRLLMDIPAGRLADFRAAFDLLAVTAGLAAAGVLVLAFANGEAMLLVGGFVLGVVSASTNATGQTYFARMAPPKRRAVLMAGYSAALLSGQSLGPSLGGVLAQVSDWRRALVAAGVLAALLMLVLVLAGRGRTRGGGASKPAAAPAPAVPLGRAERVALYLVPFGMWLYQGALLQTLVPIVAVRSLHLSTAILGVILGAVGIVRFAGTYVGGQLADRVSRKWSLVPGVVLQAVGAALLVDTSQLAVWLAALAVLSIGSYCLNIATVIVAERSGEGVGRALGQYRFAGDVGFVVGPWVISSVFDASGFTAATLAVAGVFLIIAAFTAIAVREVPAAAV